MNQNKPPLDPHPLSDYVVWAGGRSWEPLVDFERLHFQQADKKPIFNI